MHVVATAGHVDHGKSSLVRALTGTDPDRFLEEKRRGLTIDIGFAHTVLPSGRTISFIDVPGHVRFLKNMLAGVGAVDACLFVVAATEAWKPQSEEHLRILELLGIRHGVIALTKIDVVDDDHCELVRMEVVDHVAGTFLDGAEIVPVAAPKGRGLDQLRAALDRLVRETPTAVDRGRSRLWIDRVFAAKGSGTIVTGTLIGGTLQADDQLSAVPAGVKARVRSLQTLGLAVASIGPGNRVAVNLAGVEHSELGRGDALIRAEQWRPSRILDCSLQVLESLTHVVSRRGAHVAYLGSGEWPCRVRVLGPSSIAPGERGFVRLHLPTALALMPGDRFILRESGRSETIGGGEVLDVDPCRPASKARPDRSVDRVIAERGFVGVDDLEALTGERRTASLGRWVAAPEAVLQMRRAVVALIEGAGPLGLDVAALDERQRLVVDGLEGISLLAGRARLTAAVDPLADHPYVAALADGGHAPPGADGVDRAQLRALIQRGLIVERDGVYFHPSAIEDASQVAAALLANSPDGFTVAEFRDAVGATRKFVLPLVAELDGRGVTRRRGDVRIAGPRLPSVQ